MHSPNAASAMPAAVAGAFAAVRSAAEAFAAARLAAVVFAEPPSAVASAAERSAGADSDTLAAADSGGEEHRIDLLGIRAQPGLDRSGVGAQLAG